MDNVTGHLGGISRFYQQLEEKTSEHGGLENLFGMYSKIRKSLETVNIGEIDSFLVEIERAKGALDDLEKAVAEIRVLKEAFDSNNRSR